MPRKSQGQPWHGNLAEAMLVKHAQSWAQASDCDALGMSESCSAPVLTPLGPPPSSSPFAHLLPHLYREPDEFAQQRVQLARRKARQELHLLYRRCIESLGVKFLADPPPWPPKEPVVKDWWPEKPPTKAVYRAIPGSLQALEPLQRKERSLMSSTGSSESSRDSSRHKAAMQQLHQFGRGTHGAPYTLALVAEHVEASRHLRKANDVRAHAGRLGPLIIGQGTTMERRPLPFVPQSQHSTSQEAFWTVPARRKDTLLKSIQNRDVEGSVALLSAPKVLGLNDLDRANCSVLHWAISCNLPEVALEVLKRPDFRQINAKALEFGTTALHWAADSGYAEICSATLSRVDFSEATARVQKDWDAGLEQDWRTGDTALDIALRNGHAAAARVLEARCSPKSSPKVSPKGRRLPSAGGLL